MVEWIVKKFKDYLEEGERKKEVYRKETLDRRFNGLRSNQTFTILHLFDPMEYPLIVTSEHVAKFIDQKRELNEVCFEYYLKCPQCRSACDLMKESSSQDCYKCGSSIIHNKENTFISFKKI